MLQMLAWRLLAVLFVGLGLLGVIVPGMPTTVFMLLAMWAAGHGWPALQRWILAHPRFGPSVRQWNSHGAIPRRAKWLAAISILVSVSIICLSASPVWVKWLLPSCLCVVLAWLCSRPSASGT
ncbi:MAG: YbaN family protein [Marinobacter sp.]|uniref:YbaN family protein n=1 Tax=Marinobacter sp. TaxID=50741 RepID=UPI003F9D47C8